MKYLKKFLAISAFMSLLIVMSCGGGDDEPDDPAGKAVGDQMTAGTWTPVENGVSMDNTPREEWGDFTLSFSTNSDYTGGSYSCTGLPVEDENQLVWKSSGTWEFGNEGTNFSEIVRDDGIVMDMIISVADPANPSGGTLNLSFTTTEPAAEQKDLLEIGFSPLRSSK